MILLTWMKTIINVLEIELDLNIIEIHLVSFLSMCKIFNDCLNNALNEKIVTHHRF